MPIQTFRYAACGGGNTLLNIFIYFILYNYVLKPDILPNHVVFNAPEKQHVFHFSFLAISTHIAAYFIAFCITFPIGFYLSMYVVFPGATMKKRVQLFRYLIVVLICIVLNYVFLKLFVDTFGWYPTPSLMLTAVIVIAFSYFSQRFFSFRQAKTV